MKVCAIVGFATGLFLFGTAYLAWVRYPNCGEDHVPAFSFYGTDTLWVCTRGFSPPWPVNNPKK